MTVKELVEFMKKNTNRMMKEAQIAELLAKQLEPKSYIGIKDKMALVDRIVNESIYYDNSVYKFNGIERYVYFTMYTIEAYTNIELSNDVFDDFDALSESKLLPMVICLIQQEFDDVNIFLQMQCDYILEDNSTESLLGRLFNSALEKIDTVADGISKYFANIDMEKIMEGKDKIFKYFEGINK